MKYKEYEIDIEKTNYNEGVAILNLPDDSILCIPEDGANTEELNIIQQIKEDVRKRVVQVKAPTEEEKQASYDALSVQYIHEKYSLDDENKIMREYLSDMSNTTYKEAFEAYNTYVGECKQKSYEKVYRSK